MYCGGVICVLFGEMVTYRTVGWSEAVQRHVQLHRWLRAGRWVMLEPL